MSSHSENILISHKHTCTLTELTQSYSITDIHIRDNEIHLTSTLNSLFISEVRKCHPSLFARAIQCDVITLMVFHWDWSLNEDIKAVACFYMHGRVTLLAFFICMEGWHAGVTVASSHHSSNGRTMHTGTESQQMSKICTSRVIAPMFRRNASIYFFSSLA